MAKIPKSPRSNCYFGCAVQGPFHHFPKPYNDTERFEVWKAVLDSDLQKLGNMYIYNQMRFCNNHFEPYYISPANRLTRNAIPTLNVGRGLASKHTISALGTTLITPQTSCDAQKDSRIASEAGPSSTCVDTGQGLTNEQSSNIEDGGGGDSSSLDPHIDASEQAEEIQEEVQAEEIQIEVEEEIDEKAPYKICRICLATNRRLYHLSEHCRDKMLEQVTRISSVSDARLPQYICWECSARMLQAHTFMNKAHRTDVLLHKLLHKGIEGDHISIVDIQSINRKKKGLESCLTTCVIEEVCDENSQYRLQIRDLKTEDEIKKEVEDNDSQEEKVQESVESDIKELEVPVVEYLEEDLGEVLEYVLPTVGITDDEVKEAEPIEYLEELPEDVQEDSNELITLDDIEKALKELQSNVEGKKEGTKVKRTEDDVQDLIERRNKYTCKSRKKLSVDLSSVFTITQLSYEQQIEEVNKRRESESYMSAPYKCDICYRGYKDLHAYNTHKAYHSDSRGLSECPICKRRSKSLSRLRRHMVGAHKEQYDCKQCNYTTRHRTAAMSHRAWHAGKTYICEQCGKQFQKATTYMTHLRLKHVSGFLCQLCGYTFINENGLKSHKSNVHNIKPHDTILVSGPHCEACNVQFASQEAYETHIVMSYKHNQDSRRLEILKERRKQCGTIRKRQYKVYECELCGIQITGTKPYIEHFKSTHPGKRPTKLTPQTPRTCHICGKTLKNGLMLKYHMDRHVGVTYKCDVCQKQFNMKSTLYTHIKFRHKGEPRPRVPCNVCGKYFAGRSNLNKHMMRHTGLRNYACSICDKTFKTSDEMRAHLLHFHLRKPWPKRNRGRSISEDVPVDNNVPRAAMYRDGTDSIHVPVDNNVPRAAIYRDGTDINHVHVDNNVPRAAMYRDGTDSIHVPVDNNVPRAAIYRDGTDINHVHVDNNVPRAAMYRDGTDINHVPHTLSTLLRHKRARDGTLRNVTSSSDASVPKTTWDGTYLRDVPVEDTEVHESRLQRALDRITYNIEAPETNILEIYKPQTDDAKILIKIPDAATQKINQPRPKTRVKQGITVAGPSETNPPLPRTTRSGKTVPVASQEINKPKKMPVKKSVTVTSHGESSKSRVRKDTPHSSVGSKTSIKLSRNVAQTTAVEVIQQPSAWNIPPSFEDYEF